MLASIYEKTTSNAYTETVWSVLPINRLTPWFSPSQNLQNAIAQEIQEELDRQQVKKDTELKERSARVRRVQLT